jgi:hypothetical protein
MSQEDTMRLAAEIATFGPAASGLAASPDAKAVGRDLLDAAGRHFLPNVAQPRKRACDGVQAAWLADRGMHLNSSVRPSNQKVVDFHSRPKLCRHPARLFTSSGPGFRGPFRIAIFWMNLRVGPAGLLLLLNASGEPSQATLKLLLFCVQFCREDRTDFFTQTPKRFCRHDCEILVFHVCLRDF